MVLTKHDWMLAWVNLVHSGSWLTSSLDSHLREELGIGVAEQDLLKQLAVNGGEIMLSELARRVFLSKPGMTKMIDRLEKEGLVKRVPSKTDRRATSAVLTKRGTATFDRSRELLEAFAQRSFRKHLEDEEIVQLQEILQAFLERSGRWDAQMRHLRGDPHDEA